MNGRHSDSVLDIANALKTAQDSSLDLVPRQLLMGLVVQFYDVSRYVLLSHQLYDASAK
jgi:hypothetical protein